MFLDYKKSPAVATPPVYSSFTKDSSWGLTEKNQLFTPVLFVIVLIPLLIHLFIIDVDPNEAPLLGLETYGDFFSQSKSFFLLIFTFIMLILCTLFRKKLFNNNQFPIVYLAASSVFVFFTILSAVFSKYHSIAFWGVHDRAEGAVVLCSYIVLFLYSFFSLRDGKDVHHLFIALGVVTVISSILGFFQYIGQDLLFTDLGKYFIVSPWDFDKISDLSSASPSGRLYGTFYHWNYAGSFAAITVPLFGILAFSAKSWRARILVWGTTLMALWILIGSSSRAGIIGFFIALLFGLILFAGMIAKHWKISVSCLIVAVLAIIGLNTASNGALFFRIPTLVADITTIFQSSDQKDYLSKLPVKNVTSQNNTATIVTQSGNILKISLTTDGIALMDENSHPLKAEKQNGVLRTTDERFQNISVNLVEMGLNRTTIGMCINIENQPQFFFQIDANYNLWLSNSTGTVRIDSLDAPPSYGFAGKEKIGSARGYIWSRSLPMASKHLVLGAGPDTFVLDFPQNDLLGKYWAYGTTNMLVDKPHNLYLQILIGQGGIALLAFLTIVILYLIDSIRLYAFKRTYAPNEIIASAICLGVVGYLGAGLFNDSVVSVAPIFWILLGVGIAINVQNRKLCTGSNTTEPATLQSTSKSSTSELTN